jgi:hypothetical protein
MSPTLIILCLASVADSSCPGVLSAHDTVIIEGICLHNDSDEVGSFEFPIISFDGSPIMFVSPNLHLCEQSYSLDIAQFYFGVRAR